MSFKKTKKKEQKKKNVNKHVNLKKHISRDRVALENTSVKRNSFRNSTNDTHDYCTLLTKFSSNSISKYATTAWKEDKKHDINKLLVTL